MKRKLVRMGYQRQLAGLILALVTLPVHAFETLAAAVRAGDSTEVDRLLGEGADVNQRDNLLTPLAIASITGKLEFVERLLDAGADPDLPSLNGGNALSMALRSCRASAPLIDMLIEAGADLEDRSGDGITPLILTVQEERTALALQLIDAGADIDALNPYGEGALNYAIYTENARLIRTLLTRGANTAQLSLLFTTIEYDPPGIGEAQPHHGVLCE